MAQGSNNRSQDGVTALECDRAATATGTVGEHSDAASHGRVANSGVTVRPGPEEVRKRRLTGRRRWYRGSLIALSFLVIVMAQVAFTGGSVVSIVAFEVLALCFAAVYLLAPVRVGEAPYLPASAADTGGMRSHWRQCWVSPCR